MNKAKPSMEKSEIFDLFWTEMLSNIHILHDLFLW